MQANNDDEVEKPHTININETKKKTKNKIANLTARVFDFFDLSIFLLRILGFFYSIVLFFIHSAPALCFVRLCTIFLFACVFVLGTQFVMMNRASLLCPYLSITKVFHWTNHCFPLCGYFVIAGYLAEMLWADRADRKPDDTLSAFSLCYIPPTMDFGFLFYHFPVVERIALSSTAQK